MSDERDIQTTSRVGRIALVVMFLVSLVGMGVSVELTVIYHRANADASHKSHCSVGSEWDCDDVARSKYARLLGAPVALWGVVGFGIMAFFAGWAGFRRVPRHWPLGVLLILLLCSIAMSGYLAHASYLVLKKKCQYCAGLYGVTGALTVIYLVALVAQRVNPLAALRDNVTWLLDHLNVTGTIAAFVLAFTAIVLVVGPRLGKGQTRPKKVTVEDLIKKPPVPRSSMGSDPRRAQPLPPLPKGPPKWVTAMVPKGTPGLGPADADMYIVEFSDYECPFCQLSNKEMEKVLTKYGKRIRLYHRHFPLDKKCFRKMKRQMHEHACFAAAAAICAHKQGKFWAFHNAQFRLGRKIRESTIRALARKTGLDMTAFEACLKAPATKKQIQEDIDAAVALKVRGTPTFFMGGPLLDQFQPPGIAVEMFDKLFNALDKAKAEYAAKRRRSQPGGARPRPMAAMAAVP